MANLRSLVEGVPKQGEAAALKIEKEKDVRVAKLTRATISRRTSLHLRGKLEGVRRNTYSAFPCVTLALELPWPPAPLVKAFCFF